MANNETPNDERMTNVPMTNGEGLGYLVIGYFGIRH
jgi:hypothetical protein